MKKHFPLPLRGELVRPGRWKLTAPFEYRNLPVKIVVPIGFVTDGASIPRIVWTILGSPWSGKYAKAAVIHDFLCEQNVLRQYADDIFYDGMKILGVRPFKRLILYWAVRFWSICKG